MGTKFKKWWWFSMRNPIVREGEHGGFKWRFRRFTLEISTLSGNWKAKWTAAEHPYGYLLAGSGDENIEGFAQAMYEVGMLLTTDQGFVNDIQKALKKYSSRLEKKAAKDIVEDETEEKIALEAEKQVQEHIELPRKERKKRERDINKRFKASAKYVQKGSDGDL
jgi:hypothetical protein